MWFWCVWPEMTWCWIETDARYKWFRKGDVFCAESMAEEIRFIYTYAMRKIMIAWRDSRHRIPKISKSRKILKILKEKNTFPGYPFGCWWTRISNPNPPPKKLLDFPTRWRPPQLCLLVGPPSWYEFILNYRIHQVRQLLHLKNDHEKSQWTKNTIFSGHCVTASRPEMLSFTMWVCLKIVYP